MLEVNMTDNPTPFTGVEKDVTHDFKVEIQGPLDVVSSDWYVSDPSYWTRNTNYPFMKLLTGIRSSPTLRDAWNPLPEGQPTLADVPQAVKQRCLDRMMPKVNDGVSLINFLIELKDLRRMFDFQTVEKLLYVCGLTSQLARKWRRWKTLPQSFQNNPIQTISNDYLNWNFGWKPFVGDLFAMYKALKGLGKRLDYLERHQGRVLRRRRGIYLDVPDLPGGVLWSGYQIQMWQHYGPSGNGQEYDAAYIRRDNSYDYQPRYQATIDYTYTFPQGVFGETRRKIRGFLDSLGFKLDASILERDPV
jgi:hypothetical protein